GRAGVAAVAVRDRNPGGGPRPVAVAGPRARPAAPAAGPAFVGRVEAWRGPTLGSLAGRRASSQSLLDPTYGIRLEWCDEPEGECRCPELQPRPLPGGAPRLGAGPDVPGLRGDLPGRRQLRREPRRL